MVTQVLKRPQPWTPARQAEAVLSILRGEATVEEVAGEHGLDPAEVQAWRDRFLQAGQAALAGAPARAEGAMRGDRRVCQDIAQAVGRTPLVRLNRVVEGFPGEVWAKLEFMNPMGSVKDRLGKHLVERAAADGRLAPGGTLVEASSGNTAMGLGMMAVLRGYRCKVAVRDRTSKEKVDALRAIGVEVEVVDGALPPDHPESYARVIERIVRETPGAYFPDQHNNRENNEAHYLTTGPELWEQMDGEVDYFVAGMGTGGTISGVARYLKERDPRVKVIAVDPVGSVFAEYFRTRRLGAPGPYLVEGLGDESLCACVEWDLIDDVFTVRDRDAFQGARDLARDDAILAGGSSGAALWGVRELIRRLDGFPARIATLFPDGAGRYMSKVFNDDWLRGRGLL
ncbi:MAG: pyridoxal-phosphate dependent enzyme [Planctomycetota bacterium]|nr:pyridoxal-phosphate dependent enzyme [Planctomycetota bacterium]